jgi:hypothetical protein
MLVGAIVVFFGLGIPDGWESIRCPVEYAEAVKNMQRLGQPVVCIVKVR